ncbi:unnamed protein product [Echinostoma caproni]|uniref:SSD domain-containing protein n=1 Tax=Echinostoma caproni TaxID=27848 RepID=A0A183AYC1_9TREM|nr:unnamed protein product [Echinostoma caproni]
MCRDRTTLQCAHDSAHLLITAPIYFLSLRVSVQVLPFLLMGLGVDGVFTLTTCHDCCVARRATCSALNSNSSKASSLTPWASNSSIATCSSGSTGTSSTYYSSLSSATSYTAPVLAQHGPSLLYGTIAIAGAFFSAAYIPIPLMRQFCLQAGILVLVQSASVFLLFPVLLQFDGLRRSQRRLDILCCLRHPAALDATTTSLLRPINHPVYTSSTSASHVRLRRHVDRLNVINHLTPMPRDHITDITCSTLGGTEHACALGSSHTVHATVTVQGLGENAPTVTNTTTTTSSSSSLAAAVATTTNTIPGVSKSTGSERDVPCAGRVKKCCPVTQFHSEIPDSGVAQTSVHHYASRSHTPSRTLVSRIGMIERSSRPSSSLLVRFSRRLALLLTYHWSIQVVICLLGCSLFIVTGYILRCCLHLGLDWASLTPMDTVEYGFVKASEKAFGLYNFQLVARGTDLPGSRPAPLSASSPLTVASAVSQTGTSSANRLLRMGTTSTGRVDSVSGGVLASPGGLTRTGTNVATVGRGIDFPMQQRRLQYLYARLLQLPGVMLAGRQVWLTMMRDWLQHVQDAFDTDRARGQITEQGEWSANATELGVLGLRLIVQTDRGPELGRVSLPSKVVVSL